MTLTLTKHQKIELSKHPGFSETWLHDCICKDTSMLGLGELDVIDRERSQYSGGRLDILLADSDNTRYEIEVMLGATDPSHIIRCIEYWDIERRRYPAYDHIAVLVAEEVTSRFLNVMSLMAGNIPMIAIQLNALQVGEHIVLDFVKVLDQRALREDDTGDSGGEDVDRTTWQAKVGDAMLAICDEIRQIADEKSDTPLELKYKGRYIAVTSAGSFFNVLMMYPKRQWVGVGRSIANATEWHKRFEEVGLPASLKNNGTRVFVRVTTETLNEHKDLMAEFIHQAVDEYQS